MGKEMAISCGGTLNYWQEGEKIFFRVEFPGAAGESYKVWLVGSGGNEMLLGTTGGQHRLFRTVSYTQLKYSGCWPVQRVRVGRVPKRQRKPEGEWYCEEQPAQLLHEDIKSGRQLNAMLCRRHPEGFELAVPLSENKPIGLNDLFCFAVLKRMEGKAYLVWRFDREGRPEFSQDGRRK